MKKKAPQHNKQTKKIDSQSQTICKPDQKESLIYIYDPKTKKWKVHNPSGSTAYNYLTRDEWSWLD